MASSEAHKDQDGADILLSQLFGNVTVTFTADDSGPLPLDDPNFVKELQSKAGIILKCELKYDDGEKQPAKYSLQGSWEEISKAKKYLRKWVHGTLDDAQNRRSKIPLGAENGIIPPVGDDFNKSAKGREPDGGRNRNLRKPGDDQPEARPDELEEHSSGSSISDQRKKDKSRRSGEPYYGRDVHVKPGHTAKGSLSKSKTTPDSLSYSKSPDVSEYHQTLPSRTKSRHQDLSLDLNSDQHVGSGMPADGVRNGRQGIQHVSNSAVEQDPSKNPDVSRNQTTSQEVEIRRKLSDRNLQNTGDSETQMPTRSSYTIPKSSDVPTQRSDLNQMTPNSMPTNSNMPFDDQESSPEGASGHPSDLENINFVPVDAGVYCFIRKMYNDEIKKIERQYKVKISSQDMDVNESSMVKIVPDGRGSDIRGANEAVVDLYSTVFTEMKHRVVQLEESSISREALHQAITTAESMYREVMVILSGRKVMIYGMKELDVKVVKSLITTRLYDTGRSRSHHNDEWPDDTGRSGYGSSQVEQLLGRPDVMTPEDHIANKQPPLVGLDNGHQTAIANHQDNRLNGDHVTQTGASRSEDHESPNAFEASLKGFEADDEGQMDDRDQDDSSPRLAEDVSPRVEAERMGLKYRFKHNRLSFRTAEGLKVRVYQADITKETVGAIVNAANESLIHAGGVAGAIERAAGPVMTSECKVYIAKHGMLYPSEVMSTTSGNLPCRYIIHAVGPRWEEYKNKEECYETLMTTFVRCLEYAKKVYVAGLSMPLISSGIFGMPLAACIDALYEALLHYSKGWHKDVNVLKEVNIVEIDSDTVKTIQKHFLRKITGESATQQRDVEHLDPSGQPRDDTRHASGRSRPQDENKTAMDPVDELFDANRTRMHEGSTQTSLLYPGTDNLLYRGRLNDLNHYSQEMDHHNVSRFGAQKFSSLPNLSPEYRDDREHPASNNRLAASTESRYSALDVKLHTSASALSNDASKQDVDRLHNDIGNRGLGSRGPEASSSSQKEREMLGAVGGAKDTSEDLIQTILTEHDRGRQTPEQAAETQKLLDQLLGGDGPARRPREKGHRSRRTQSLDRAPRKSKEKDVDLGGYNLHSDARVNKLVDEFKKCSVCHFKNDLTNRKGCEHKLCKGCDRAGLYKGSCAFCKRNSRAKSQSKSVDDEPRGRPRSKKMPDLNPRGQSTKDFHVRQSANSTGSHRKGPMTVYHVDSPPSSPRNMRLDPVGQAPEARYGLTNHYSQSSNQSSRTEAWVSDSAKTSHLVGTSKQYDHRTYSTNTAGSRDGRSARERRRNHSSDDDLVRTRTERDVRSGDVSAGAGGNEVTCPICMEGVRNPKTLSECRHTFCVGCIDTAMKLKPVCPVCGVVYGPLYGNQPAGTMTNYVEPTDLPGYQGCGTIVISYRFPDGVQGEDHPNPGQQFKGTARMAYLPNNIEGQRVFRLLEKAFKARLLFTIGQSVTTGMGNCVVWNDVHHKTRRTGGAENHGYPDPGYLKRVTDELSAKGIK